ncbi:MAG: nickel insertion protein [Dialister invisus]
MKNRKRRTSLPRHEEGHDGRQYAAVRKKIIITHRLTGNSSMIDACDMTETAKALARKIFRIIGEAEAKAHGLPLTKSIS